MDTYVSLHTGVRRNGMNAQAEDAFFDDAPFIPDFSVTAQNLLHLDECIIRAEERRICELSVSASAAVDAAVQMLDGGMKPGEVLTLLSEEFALPHAVLHEDALHTNIAHLRLRADMRRSADEAAFCQMFCRELTQRRGDLDESSLLPTTRKSKSVAYVKNAYADEAFDVFCAETTDLQAEFVHTFAEAVDKMRRGEVGYCLFPFEEEGGVRLSSVQQLIYQNDLKIVSVTPVFGYDGTAELSYALLAPSFDPIHYESTDDLYLEIALARDDTAMFTLVLSAAQSLGITVYRADTVHYMTGDEAHTVCSLVLRDSRHDLFAFLCYLWLFVPEFTPVGFYKNVE